MMLKRPGGLLAEGNRSESKNMGVDNAQAPRKKKRPIKISEEESRGGTRKIGSPTYIKDSLFGRDHPHGDENTKRQGRR
jgi:hypothetical protein